MTFRSFADIIELITEERGKAMNFTNNNGNNNGNGFNNGYNNNGFNQGYNNNGFNQGYNNGYNNGNTQFNQNMFNNQNMNNGYNQGGFGFNQQQYNQQYNQQFNQPQYANNTNGQGVGKSFMDSFANPRIRSLRKHAGEGVGDDVSTFQGLAAKTIYFVMVFALGLVSFFILHNVFSKNSVITDGGLLYQQEFVIYIGALVLALISGIVTAFAPKATAFFGTVYCVCMGYAVTVTSYAYAQQYKGIVYEALGLTLLIIGVLTVLYSKGVIRVTGRFRKVVYTTLIVSLIGGAIFTIIYLCAPNSGFVRSIIEINNGPIGILFAVIGVALASAILTIDFDNAAQTVQQGLPKTYEWVASFSLITGVIYLYLKVLQLLAKIQNNK